MAALLCERRLVTELCKGLAEAGRQSFEWGVAASSFSSLLKRDKYL